MKTCSKCKEVKHVSCFHKDKQKSDGLYSSCKQCMALYTSSENYREKRKHPRYKAIRRKFKIKTYGLTIEQYKTMFDSQNGKCAICGIHQSELTKELSIDHSHSNGKVRGLLCNNCNSGIGYFSDSITKMKQAIDYLEKANGA